MTDLITEARELIEALHAGVYDDEYIGTGAYVILDELCDALEKYRWIPVTERLPTECGYYLSVVERMAPDELGGNNTRVKIMRWLGADWRYPTHVPKWINEAITETVTRWMPLPAPPEEGE